MDYLWEVTHRICCNTSGEMRRRQGWNASQSAMRYRINYALIYKVQIPLVLIHKGCTVARYLSIYKGCTVARYLSIYLLKVCVTDAHRSHILLQEAVIKLGYNTVPQALGILLQKAWYFLLDSSWRCRTKTKEKDKARKWTGLIMIISLVYPLPSFDLAKK